MTDRRRALVAAIYYLGLCLLLVLICSKTWSHIVPGTVGRHIANDSEGYVLALLLPAWIDFVRPRLKGRSAEWPVTVVAAAVCLGVLLLLYHSTTIISSVKTLNETFFALALLIPYVQLTRRPSVNVGIALAVASIVLLVIVEQTAWLPVSTALAEGVVMLNLAPLMFDVFDRGILQPEAPSPLRLRQAWLALMVVMVLGFIAVGHFGHHLPSAVLSVDVYGRRAQEAFVGMFLIGAYYLLRPTLRAGGVAIPGQTPRDEVAVPERA
jgi:hypothetical protein